MGPTDNPIIHLAGAGLRDLIQSRRRLFALLKGCDAPPALRQKVRVLSLSASAAAVFTAEEHPGVIAVHARVAQAMAADLLSEEPEIPALELVSRKPMMSSSVEAATRVMHYTAFRFPMDQPFGAAEPLPRNRARALWAVGRPDRALALLKATVASSEDPEDHWLLGVLLLHCLDKPTSARPHLERACELNPTHVEPFMSLGIVCAATNDRAGRIAAFERAVELEPGAFVAWANLAQACHGHDDGRMREAAARAQELSPGEPITGALLAGVSFDEYIKRPEVRDRIRPAPLRRTLLPGVDE
jgi:tetratricopeptide (TPR) repeat protein